MSYKSWPLSPDNPDKFVIQDVQGLRHAIQPIVSISSIQDKITGLGTSFQISPWTRVTAHHVVIDKSSGDAFPTGEVGAVGFHPGLAYGRIGFLSTDYFAKISQIMTFPKPVSDQPDFMPGPKPAEIQIDVAGLYLDKSLITVPDIVNPLPISRQPVKVGDKVLGVGFDILGADIPIQDQKALYQERLIGSAGHVTEILKDGQSTSYPWPTFRVECDWTGGMSGGPVINENQQVVGMISRSSAATNSEKGIGYAVDLTRIPIRKIAPELDLANPGWHYGHGIFDKNDHLVAMMPNPSMAKQAIKVLSAAYTRPLTYNPKDGSRIFL